MAGKGKGVKKPAVAKKKANGYKMPDPIAAGEVIYDIVTKKKWRIGPSIGVGGFGEIYSACEHDTSSKNPVYSYVIKVEPHENGPLFVEKNFYLRNANQADITKFMKTKKLSSLGMPTYFGNGSHEYKGEKYRYLVLERYGQDLWSMFTSCGRKFPSTTVFIIGLQMLDVLEYIHSRGYVHADIKGGNILLGLKKGAENQAYLVDFGLATRISDKEFKPDPKSAHDGTIEYTSRDAHLGEPTMRGDLEILGYNMLQWIASSLPWESCLKTPAKVQAMKEDFMKNVQTHAAKLKAPDTLIQFFEYINTLKPKEVPNFTKCRQLFEAYLKSEGKTRNDKLNFKPDKKQIEKDIEDSDSSPVKKRGRSKTDTSNKQVKKVKNTKAKVLENSENEEPDDSLSEKVVKRRGKRKSNEPLLLVKVKKTKLAPKATPPAKKNHTNIATQTSVEKRRSPRQVSFDSPISEIIGEQKILKKKDLSANSSGDLFEDSFTMDGKKIRPKRTLLSDEEVTVKRVKKKITTMNKAKSWKNCPSVLNGRSPPK